MKRSRRESQELQQWRYHLTPKLNFRKISEGAFCISNI